MSLLILLSSSFSLFSQQNIFISPFGLPDQRGVVITDVREGSLADLSGFRRNDVIRAVNGNEISSIEEIYAFSEENWWLGGMMLKIYRNQKEEEKRIAIK